MISARKLESYKRAEAVAQAARLWVTSGHRWSQDDVNLFADLVLDWMATTGKIKYEKPKRRRKTKHAP
jgi:hypothetical protein